MLKHSLLTAKVMVAEEFIGRVREKLPASFATFEKDRDLQDMILFNLIQAIQTCVDIAAHIVSDERMGTAGSMNEFFYRLQEKRVITVDLTEHLVKAVGFRNVCVHGYLDLDFNVAYKAAETGIKDLEDFLAAMVRNYLQ